MNRSGFISISLLSVLIIMLAACGNPENEGEQPDDSERVERPAPPPEFENKVNPFEGDANAAEPDSVVLLYNDTAKYGVMEAARANGGFEASVEAAPGDTLVLQYKLVDEISYAKYLTVK